MTVADQRILRGQAAVLSWQPVGSDGEIAAPAGAVTVGVTDSSGAVVLASGTATTGAASAPRLVALTAAQTGALDVLTVEWTVAGGGTFTTYVEIVGGFYFTIAEARASDPVLANVTKYPTAALVEHRRAVEEEFETICQVAFVPRLAVETTTGGGGISTTWPMVRSVRAVGAWDGLGYVPWTSLADIHWDATGAILTSGSVYRGVRYRIAYEHGMDRPPAEIRAAALVRLRDRASVAITATPDRATSFSVAEGGTYALDQAGITKTGLPTVDAALARWDHRSRIR